MFSELTTSQAAGGSGGGGGGAAGKSPKPVHEGFGKGVEEGEEEEEVMNKRTQYRKSHPKGNRNRGNSKTIKKT